MTPARATLLRFLACVSALAAAACNPVPSATNAPPARSISIQAGSSGTGPDKSIGLVLDDTIRISYLAADEFGHPTTATPTFLSRDLRVAAVSSRGLIRAQGAGTTVVVAYLLTTGTTFVSDSIKVVVNVVCTAIAKAGLTIAIEDSVSGSKGPFANVSYVAKDTSAFKDSTFIASVPAQLLGSPFLLGMAYEHPGKYDVTVKASGYKPWVKTGVTVSKDACHVIPVSLTARLVTQ